VLKCKKNYSIIASSLQKPQFNSIHKASGKLKYLNVDENYRLKMECFMEIGIVKCAIKWQHQCIEFIWATVCFLYIGRIENEKCQAAKCLFGRCAMCLNVKKW